MFSDIHMQPPDFLSDDLPSVSSCNSSEINEKGWLDTEDLYNRDRMHTDVDFESTSSELDLDSRMFLLDHIEECNHHTATPVSDSDGDATVCADEAEVTSPFIKINQEHYIRELDAQHAIQDIRYENECQLRRLHHDNDIRVANLEREVSRLQEQLGLWRKLAVTVVEGTDRDVQKWIGCLNDAMLWGIEEMDIPQAFSDDVCD
ncbi:hypothetical protein PM082_024603 [Marasmius tenuissimus]|nr:hypothetical protein PM082_024603 [Marasmius tenuissimus]